MKPEEQIKELEKEIEEIRKNMSDKDIEEREMMINDDLLQVNLFRAEVKLQILKEWKAVKENKLNEKEEEA